VSERVFFELLYGKGAHANTLACVEDISADLAGKTIDAFPHSIWQLVEHMNYWMDYDTARIRGEAPPYPAHAAASWPGKAERDGDDQWRKAVSNFANLLEKLSALSESSPELLVRQLPPTHEGHKKLSSSVQSVLWQTLVHNSYHVGQIAAIRRFLGAWPAKAGGDTW
jgi:uncharacterized damage-inducible protein DinB